MMTRKEGRKEAERKEEEEEGGRDYGRREKDSKRRRNEKRKEFSSGVRGTEWNGKRSKQRQKNDRVRTGRRRNGVKRQRGVGEGGEERE